VLLESVTAISDFEFSGRMESLSVQIPDSVEAIGVCAFAESCISSIIIPCSVVSLGGNPFTDYENLEVIDFSESPNFVLIDGVVMGKEVTQFIYCNPSKSGNYSIPFSDHYLCRGISWT